MNIESLKKDWDLVVIGGGITGAGILREASRLGIRTLLVERRDFAWGTSSRSSKLVHGGLRYLKEGKLFLTRDSVLERERLVKEAPGLVEPLGFLLPVFSGSGPGRIALEAGLSIYDLMSGKRRHRYFNSTELLEVVPGIRQKGLRGGFRFVDAQVDDARLVLRLIGEGIAFGGTACNYTEAVEILRNPGGSISGVTLRDIETGDAATVNTSAVINAGGVWAEALHPSPEPKRHLRPLRGSHLIFPRSRLPIDEAVSFFHPQDRRPIFAIPWEGAVLFGTTDVDHGHDLALEPRITLDEADYMLEGARMLFPSAGLNLSDCIATYAGVRPVLSEGGKAPSQESREHVVWVNKGLVTVTGGKMTTFRLLAQDTLKAAKPFLRQSVSVSRRDAIVTNVEQGQQPEALSPGQWRRLCGRYGPEADRIVGDASPADLEQIPGTESLWAELPHAAACEHSRHLTDLLLRRVRIGLLLPAGGAEHMDRIRRLCSPRLSWDNERWKQEIENYRKVWKEAYGVPAV